MAWFKIDDRFHSHPKVVQAGNAAIGAWVRLGAWCSDHLTDGHIPHQVASMFATESELEQLHETELLRATGTGWVIPDYLDFNPSAAEVLATRTKRSAAASVAGRKSATQRATKTERSANADATQTQRSSERSTNEKATPHPHPHPHPTTTTGVADSTTVGNSARDLAIAHAYAAHAISQAQQRGTRIQNLDAYRAALEQAALTNPDLQRLATMFPTAPAEVIAAALAGEKHSLAYYARADEPASEATIIDLQSRTAQ